MFSLMIPSPTSIIILYSFQLSDYTVPTRPDSIKKIVEKNHGTNSTNSNFNLTSFCRIK